MLIGPDRTLWDVAEEHLDEASFLWGQWELALFSPLYTVKEVAERVERRMLAHLDGLVVGGELVAQRLLQSALVAGTTSEAFAAAYALVDSGSAVQTQLVFDPLRAAGDVQMAGIQRALALLPRPEVALQLRRMLSSEKASVRATALGILAFQRVDVSKELAALLQDPDPAVLNAALQAVSSLAAASYAHLVRYHLGSADKDVCAAAVTAGAILGIEEVWPRCRTLATDPTAPHGPALLLLALTGRSADQRLILEATASPGLQRAALFALGFSGTIDAADACVQLMQNPALAPLAGEAFAAITGVDLAAEKLLADGDEEEAEKPVSLDEEDLDTDLSLGPEDDLAVPDGPAVAAWWRERRKSLQTQTLCNYGRPADQNTLVAALGSAPMRRRHGLALDLAIRTRGAMQIQTRALAQDQLAEAARRPAR